MKNRVAHINSNRVNDSVISVRLDRRPLATLAMFFEKTGDYPTSISMLMRMIVEELKEILVSHSLIEEVVSTNDATIILRRYGITNLNSGRRGERQYHKRLELEDLEAEFGNNSLEVLEYMTSKKTTKNIDTAMLKEAKRLMATGTIKREIEAKKDESEALSTTEPLSDEAKDRIMKAQGKDNSEKSALMQIPPLANATNEP